jgi:hypothetical protein
VGADEVAEVVIDGQVGLGDLAGVGLAGHQQLAAAVQVQAALVGGVGQEAREGEVVGVCR